jgi:hypothetical protein
MRVKQFWVIAAGCSLLSAPAWAHSSHDGAAGGKQKNRGSSIHLTTTQQRSELFTVSPCLGEELPSVSKAFAKNGRIIGTAAVGGLPPGLEKKIGGIRLQGKQGKNLRGPRDQGTPSFTPTPAIAAATPIPEPSALLFFGVGLVVARRAIGREWRQSSP